MNTRRVLVKAGWDASVRHLFATRGDTAVCVLCVLCVLCVQLQMQCGFLPRDAQGTGTGTGTGLCLFPGDTVQCSTDARERERQCQCAACALPYRGEARRGEARRGDLDPRCVRVRVRVRDRDRPAPHRTAQGSAGQGSAAQRRAVDVFRFPFSFLICALRCVALSTGVGHPTLPVRPPPPRR